MRVNGVVLSLALATSLCADPGTITSVVQTSNGSYAIYPPTDVTINGSNLTYPGETQLYVAVRHFIRAEYPPTWGQPCGNGGPVCQPAKAYYSFYQALPGSQDWSDSSTAITFYYAPSNTPDEVDDEYSSHFPQGDVYYVCDGSDTRGSAYSCAVSQQLF